jgi:hypothetical protein
MSLIGKFLSLVLFVSTVATTYMVYIGLKPMPPGADRTGVFGHWLGVLVIAGIAVLSGLLARWLVPAEEGLLRQAVTYCLVGVVIGINLLFIYALLQIGA